MNSSIKPFFELEGVFFTHQDGAVEGYAYTDGYTWYITSEDQEFSRTTLYLDRDKKVIAPKNLHQKNWANDRINELISEYKLKVSELEHMVNNLNIDTFKMKLSMAESYLVEYKSLKYSYFAGNSLKFILF